jgi:small subunit ribosomal protein S8
MGMTDPIADMLTRIRNASRARHQRVSVPWSRLKESIIKILIEEGYLKDQKKVKAAVGGGEEIVIQLKFDRENRPIIAGLKRVSTPGRRVYVSSKVWLLCAKAWECMCSRRRKGFWWIVRLRRLRSVAN